MTSKFMYWSYCYGFSQVKDFPDPRIPVARHTGWKKTTTEFTDYPTPEPDNYNRAIFTVKPQECPLIEDQVIYYDRVRNGWITLMYVPPNQIKDIDAWIYRSKKIAVWCHLKPPKVKPNRTLLWTRNNVSDNAMTDNERLYTMGYFETFKVKYFSDDATYVDSLLGEARASLEDLVPEEQDYTDYCDN